MKKSLKRLWIDALKGDEYEQGLGTLRTHENKFCCLGVLGDLLVRGAAMDITAEWKGQHLEVRNSCGQYRICTGTLCSIDQLGLSGDQRLTLARLNDIKKISFSEIADWIEKNVPEEEE